jgi:ATP-dependent DNA ligase
LAWRRLRLASRQGKDFTRCFPELAAAIKALHFRTVMVIFE